MLFNAVFVCIQGSCGVDFGIYFGVFCGAACLKKGVGGVPEEVFNSDGYSHDHVFCCGGVFMIKAVLINKHTDT